MGYAQAFRLLVAGYKKIKGKMPEGLDLLKIKQEAKKKVIDTNKVIKVNFDKANNWMKAKPQSTKVKGKAAETEAEMIARMNRQNKESVARLKDKKEKSLGEKLRDYKGDPDAMKDGGKVKKKRKHDDNIDEEDIGEGKSKERFLRVMPQASGIPRLDGIMELATGGRVRFAQGGTQYTPTTYTRMQNHASQSAAQAAASQAAASGTGIQNVPTAQLRSIRGRQAQQPMTPQQFITANTKPGSQNTPTSLLNLYYRNSPIVAPVGVLSLAEMDAKRARILAEQQAQQRADSGLVDSVTGKRYISQQEAIDDLGIVVYNQRFAEGGRVNFNTGGGVSNVVGTYLANPSLQDKYTQQEYEDFFGYGTNQPSTTTTTATNVVQPSRVASPIVPNIIKPIIPISQDGGDSGGRITLGRTNMNQPNAMGGKTPGFKAGVQRAINDFKTLGGGLIDIAKTVNPLDPDKFNIMNLYKKGKEAFTKRSDKIVADQIAKAIALEEEMARRQEDIIRSRSPSGSMDYGPSGYEGMSDAASDQERSEGGRGSRG